MFLWRQLPNLISISRFLLTPVAVGALLRGDDRTAFWVSLAAGATDFLDGGLARWMGAQSRTGAVLDPLADKFMLDSLYLTLSLFRGQWVGWVVVLRDLFIVGGSLYIATRTGRRDFPPSGWGKLSTLFQIAWILFYLGDWPGQAICFWLMLSTTVFSGADYARLGLRLLQLRPKIGN